MTYTRRSFVKKSALVSAGFTVPRPLVKRVLGANDELRFGVIGCNGMGWSDMRAHLKIDGVSCVALADADSNVLARRALDAEKIQGTKPDLYGDYRRMLERKDIDAVIIGTPDHWHCLNLIDSLQAGKHVYCEKPLANSIEECNRMLKVASNSDRLVQIGQWQRSGVHYKHAIDFVRSGKLGNIRLVKVWAYQGWMKPVKVVPDGSAPNGVDYDMWLGPAPKRPFNPNRFHFNFRWFWDYAGGLMTDWGVHEIDIALFAMNATAPKSVMASGGKLAYPNDASETPDTLQAVFEYDKFNMLWEHATGIDGGNYGRTEGIAFIGNEATLVLNRQGWELIPETIGGEDGIRRNKLEGLPKQSRPGGRNYLDDHAQNFVDAIRENKPDSLACGIESGSVAAINAHMGNVAYQTGRKVYWNAQEGDFGSDHEANNAITPIYHNGWELPNE
ncbi:MAG: Gfo/Idh/MocA family oxidoreductase [Saprospiraceae bacterium]|nr:Gfo/Idh/MocA family oxidoreductase [Saprospiraceae bacterium]